MNNFDSARKVSLEEVLDSREKRSAFQQYLLKYYQGSLISFTCNIPGPIKNNEMIQSIFIRGKQMLFEKLELEKTEILVWKEWNQSTGPELFIMTTVEPILIKKWCIEIEESKVGRLFDMDVLFKTRDGRINSISRQKLNVEKRKCFICENDAKICARTKNHTLEQIYSKINELVKM